MTHVTKATFNYFCRRVRYWLKQFGVTDWTVYYTQDDIPDCAASVRIDHVNRGLTFVLPIELDDTSYKSIDHSALHEATHAALAKLDGIVTERFVSEKEATDAVEAAVCAITTLVSNLSKPRAPRE